MGYRSNVPLYEAMWQKLVSLETQARWNAGYSDVRVQIWEDTTDTGCGFNKLTSGTTADTVTYTNIKWVWVRFIRVDRKVRRGGGTVTYDTSTVEFVIDDSPTRITSPGE
jgi:hypothetical protein